MKAAESISNRASRNDKTVNILPLKITPFLIHIFTREIFLNSFFLLNKFWCFELETSLAIFSLNICMPVISYHTGCKCEAQAQGILFSILKWQAYLCHLLFQNLLFRRLLMLVIYCLSCLPEYLRASHCQLGVLPEELQNETSIVAHNCG